MGGTYANICLEHAGRFLEKGTSVYIFPEGAYVYDNKIFRGHTGASRLVYKARSIGKKVNLIPISIYVSRNDDLDGYNIVGDNVKITILPPVDYEEAYYNYRYTNSRNERNILLHYPIDIAMKCIADSLEIPYENKYIELRPKGNVMFEDGSVVDTSVAQEDEFVIRYNQELDNRALKLLGNIK